MTPATLLLVLDLTGTLVFAIEGAIAAIRGELDMLGVVVLAFATASGGGIIRDVLLGSLPPAVLRDWRYPLISVVAGLGVFAAYVLGVRVGQEPLQVLDAAGLALFAMAGTEKALSLGANPITAVSLGTITGVGGGTVRDILLAQVPSVLWSDVYATAALSGAIVMVAAIHFGVPTKPAALLGGVACFALRLVSLALHWNLPSIASPT